MKKTVFVLSLVLFGCLTELKRGMSSEGELTYKCSRQGVEYVETEYGLAVSVDKGGTPMQCGNFSK